MRKKEKRKISERERLLLYDRDFRILQPFHFTWNIVSKCFIAVTQWAAILKGHAKISLTAKKRADGMSVIGVKKAEKVLLTCEYSCSQYF